MQITALVQVLNYLKEKAEDPALTEGYRKLSDTIKEASKDSQGNSFDAILKEKEKLRKVLLDSDPAGWGYASYSLFEKLNTGKLFGKEAADYLDKLVSPENKDYTAMQADLGKKAKLYSKLSENLGKFIQLYDVVIPAETDSPSEKSEKSSMYLYFEGRLSVHNVTDLERYSGLWDGIMEVFSDLNGEVKPELDINSYQNGKIVLEINPEEKTLDALIAGTSGVLALLPVVLKIRYIQLELIPLPLSNDVNDLLEEEIQQLINDTSLEAANKLILSHFSKLKNPDDNAGDIAISLKQIYSFIEKGGKIEFNQHAGKDAARVNRELVESYAIARELEKVTIGLDQQLAEKMTS